ncbi:MAG TPA: hypothetical protein PLT86_08650 [Candidatus Latescibacteria bacterium]|nr:hypothetical protein [Candidatus Latescibacterota bacterium]HQI76637.1 hypothetical protein [Candidatus Latescibacterota bacterium]
MQGIRKLGKVQDNLVEVSPFVFRGELLLFESVRPDTPDNTRGGRHYLRIRRLPEGRRDVTGPEEFSACPVLTEFGEEYTFGVPFVWNDEIFIYASLGKKPTVDDIHVFHSRTMDNWQHSIAVRGADEQVFNSSVCRAGDRFIMAYESNFSAEWVPFTNRFAESKDLVHWTPISPDRAVHGSDRYCACPTLRHIDGTFVIVCLEMPHRGAWWFEEFAATSTDLLNWTMSPANPILAPPDDRSENINNSDIDFCGFGDKTIIYYSWGSQRGDEHLAHAVYDGPEEAFLRAMIG